MLSLPAGTADDSDKEFCTALPSVPTPAPVPTEAVPQPKAPSPLRRGSVPSTLPTLRKRTSLSALKKFFGRGRSASAEPSGRKQQEAEQPVVVEKKTVLADVFEMEA